MIYSIKVTGPWPRAVETTGQLNLSAPEFADIITGLRMEERVGIGQIGSNVYGQCSNELKKEFFSKVSVEDFPGMLQWRQWSLSRTLQSER